MLDRWCSYTPHGKPILDTRIVAFKVPLRKEMMQQRDPKERFTIKELLEAIPDLGLVIDLCNTNRYYNGKDLEALGVQHQKLICVGGSVPAKNVTERFCSLIDEYLQSNPDKLVGVHCTHGINRTGYLICRYLMSKLNLSPDDAIKAFQDARGHQIERPEFVEYLKKFEDPTFVDSNTRSNKFIPNRGRPDGQRPFSRDRRDYGDRGPRGPPYRRHKEDDYRSRNGPYDRDQGGFNRRHYDNRIPRNREVPDHWHREEVNQRPRENRHYSSTRSSKDGRRQHFNSRRSDEDRDWRAKR